MTRLYCPECSEYLEGGDGECHDCSCGWKQPVETFEDEASTLKVAYDELCEELKESQRQLDVAREFCRQYQIEIARLKVDLYSEKEKNRVQFENSKLNMENIKNLLNEAYEDNSAKQRVIEELKYEIDGMTDENQTQKVLNNHLQFLLDSIMLEYCPNEMTEEQMENWKKAQRAVDTADPEYYKSDTYKNNVKFSVDMIK